MTTFQPPMSYQRRGARIAGRGLVGIALAVSVVGVSAGSAFADDNQNTTANAEVLGGITLTDLTASFTLTGTPGATVATGSTPVTYNVETNNETGYTVTVQSTTGDMVPADGVANPDTIPIGVLTVRETGGGAYQPVTSTTSGDPVLVHTQGNRSQDGGDDLSTDFQMRIPTVNADTYSATLNYLAATQL
jgi:hypothetical protein